MGKDSNMDKKEKDRYILEQFILIYCRGQHNTSKGDLCSDCQNCWLMPTSGLSIARKTQSHHVSTAKYIATSLLIEKKSVR